MRQFFLAFPTPSIQASLSQFNIPQTLSAESAAPPDSLDPSSIFQTASGISSLSQFNLRDLARAFPLPWSHYVLLSRSAR